MKFEYTVRIFSLKELEEKGIAVDSENNLIYACRSDGSCEVHDVKVEQLDKLSSILNSMGEEGWELIQLIFHPSGIISFWKRMVEV
ncbi:MAG TPA: hypothetical protein VHO84_11050 [Syntrophorhabdaceae bacterium]|nr:hypothetical protein [Syntrophorhabdaceae bacterium]